MFVLLLGRPLIATSHAMLHMKKGKMFRFNNDEETFNICWSMK